MNAHKPALVGHGVNREGERILSSLERSRSTPVAVTVRAIILVPPHGDSSRAVPWLLQGNAPFRPVDFCYFREFDSESRQRENSNAVGAIPGTPRRRSVCYSTKLDRLLVDGPGMSLPNLERSGSLGDRSPGSSRRRSTCRNDGRGLVLRPEHERSVLKVVARVGEIGMKRGRLADGAIFEEYPRVLNRREEAGPVDKCGQVSKENGLKRWEAADLVRTQTVTRTTLRPAGTPQPA